MTDALIESLLRAVASAPADLPLRIHVAEMLMGAGRAGEALTHLTEVLAAEPGNPRARELLARAVRPDWLDFDWTKAESQFAEDDGDGRC